MLTFDQDGHLKPYEVVPSTVEDLRTYFVADIPSEIRQQHFENYVKYSNELKALLDGKNMRQWINGSFISTKTKPKDIDFITFIDYQTIQGLGKALDAFRPRNSWDNYQVDAYIIEVHAEGSEEYQRYTRSDMAYWIEQFSYARRNRKGEKKPKGFLEIVY